MGFTLTPCSGVNYTTSLIRRAPYHKKLGKNQKSDEVSQTKVAWFNIVSVFYFDIYLLVDKVTFDPYH